MTKINGIVFSILLILVSLLFKGSLSHIPYWHEQHELFKFSELYFNNYFSKPAGYLTYITNFVIQFFYFPILGSILLGFLISLVFLYNCIIVRKLFNRYDYLLFSLLPALFLLIQYCSIDYPIEVVVGIVLNQLSILLVLYLPAQIRSYAQYLVLILVFYLTGYYSCLFLLYALIFNLSTTRIYPSGILLILFTALTLLGSYYYRVPISSIFNTALSDVKLTNIILLLLFLPSLVSGCYLSTRFPKKQNLKLLLMGLSLVVYSSVTLWCLFEKHSYRTRLMLRVDEYVKESNWEKVLQTTAKYPGKNQLVCYLNNLALCYTNRMDKDLFKYPQDFGVNSLYFVWDGTSKMIEYGDLVFAAIGSYNEASRWAFESMVIYGETVPVLRKLILYNISNNKPLVAKKFIEVLKGSLFYAKEAVHYENMLNTSTLQNGIKHDSTQQNIFANFLNITNDLTYICKADSTNKRAFDYRMSNYLLSNKLIEFVENIQKIDVFGYNQLPELYEEALLIFKLRYPEEFKALNIVISTSTQARFEQYNRLYTNKEYDTLNKQFHSSYWYYLHFKSPYGNKIIDDSFSVDLHTNPKVNSSLSAQNSN